MTEKGCDNCYYTYFDERAYPCSLCIRGIERTDQWQPSKKTKADIPQAERIKTPDYCDICNHKGCDNCIANNLDDYCVPSGYKPKDEPQTEAWHDDCNTCRWHDGACTIPCCDYEPKTEPQTEDCGACEHSRITCRYMERGEPCHYKPKDEPQTDCSWQKGE